MAPDTERWEEHDAALKQFSREIGDRVADDLNAAGDTAAEVQTIYHYTDVASALAIITSGHFWFTERAHLNDTLELQYGLRIGHEMFDAAVKAAGDVVPRDAPEHLMGEVGFGMIEFGYWIASFSYEGDDLAQWRSYADEGRGVCLGFSVQELDMRQFASHIQTAFNFMRLPVRYDEAELRNRIQPFIDQGVELLRRVNLPSMPSYSQYQGRALLYERDLLQSMMSGVYLHAMMHKHKAYQHEREYRLILNAYRPKVEPSTQHKVRARNGEIVGYLDLPIPNWKFSRTLTRINVGPTAAPKLEEQLATAFRSFGLPVPKIERSKLPFRTTR
jgi:hypothetical protein